MALANWDLEAESPPKLGYALFDTGENAAASYHAMIVRDVETGSPESGVRVEVAHMKPPLFLRDPQMELLGKDHWVGWMPERTDDEYLMLLRELERLEYLAPTDPAGLTGRDRFLGYDLGPHTLFEADPNDEDQHGALVRASCASFVEHCYETIEVDLVDEGSVPVVTIEELADKIGENPRVMERQFRMAGMEMDWPCPVLLPAYQMRAFEEGLQGCPRSPSLDDHPYP